MRDNNPYDSHVNMLTVFAAINHQEPRLLSGQRPAPHHPALRPRDDTHSHLRNSLRTLPPSRPFHHRILTHRNHWLLHAPWQHRPNPPPGRLVRWGLLRRSRHISSGRTHAILARNQCQWSNEARNGKCYADHDWQSRCSHRDTAIQDQRCSKVYCWA